MNRTFAKDYTFGTTSEVNTLSAIQSFDSTIQRNTNRYALFDYSGNNVNVELKTRNNAKDKYPTTMIGYNKVKIAEQNPNLTYYFAFKYTDGLYYIKYNKELFDTFEVKEGGRWDRGRPELNQYCYIPVDKLTVLPSGVVGNTPLN